VLELAGEAREIDYLRYLPLAFHIPHGYFLYHSTVAAPAIHNRSLKIGRLLVVCKSYRGKLNDRVDVGRAFRFRVRYKAIRHTDRKARNDWLIALAAFVADQQVLLAKALLDSRKAL